MKQMIGIKLGGTSFFCSHCADRSSPPLVPEMALAAIAPNFFLNEIICCQLNTQFHVKEPFFNLNDVFLLGDLEHRIGLK